MTNTLEQLQATMRSPGQRTHGGGSWHNWCAAWVCRAVTGVGPDGTGLGASADTARQALGKSGNGGRVVSTDPAKAPAGAIHWWLNGPTGDGHVAVGMTAGSGSLAMASDAVTHAWGTASGTISLAEYSARKPAMRYVGWTLDYCGARIKVAAPAPQPAASTYTVRSGDTLVRIADAHGTTWQRLASLNGLRDPDAIAVGQKLRLR